MVFIIYKKLEARKPWPDFGGTILTIKSLDEWKAVLADADQASPKRIVVCTFMPSHALCCLYVHAIARTVWPGVVWVCSFDTRSMLHAVCIK